MISTAVITNPAAAATSFTNLPAGTNLFEATVIDGHGQNTNSIATVVVNAPILPVANPGAPQTITLPVSQVTLNGSASTGTITSYAWTQVAGPSTTDTITSPTAATTTVTGLTQGIYVFRLTLNADTSATVQVTVNAPPAPVAKAGPDQTIVLPASQVTLNGSASTGFITSYAWSQLSGPSTATITTPTSVSTTVTDLTQGEYIFQLTLNGDSTAAVQVTVNTPPPPIANAGSNQSIALPTNHVTLSANASSGTINSYSWTEISGPDSPPAVIVSPASDSTLVTGLVEGLYIFQLTLNGDSTATVQVTVKPPPPPVANAGPNQTITLPLNHVILNATASTGFITSYLWTEVSGPDSVTITSPLDDSTIVGGLSQGVYIFKVTLNGDSTSMVQVTVKPPPPPIANAGPTQTITFPASQVTLNGSASSGFITSYNWTELSGPDSSAVIAAPAAVSTTVTGLIPGVYIFQLTLNSDSISTVQVTVNPPAPPVANAGSNQSITRPLNHVMLNAKASGGFITSYSWAQLSGPASDTIISPTSDSTLVTGLVPGVYVFQLTLNGDSTATTQVTVNQPPLVANAGASQTIALPANQVTLNGSASSGIVTAYTWAQVSGPSVAAITTPALVSTTVTGLVQGSYIYQLTVRDDQGTVKTDTMTVTVNNGIVTRMINVNVYGGTNPYVNTQWNNWSVGSGSSPVFTYADATASGVTALLSINESVVDNGATYGGVMAPAPVLRYTSYCEVSRTLTLSGLKTAATYNIELYASRSSNAGQLSVFQVAGQVSDTIASFNNLTNKAVFNGLKANTSGKIVITIATPTGYNYLNGFAITELTTATTGEDPSLATSSASILAAATDSSGLSIYPNPARDQLTVNLNNSHSGAMKIILTGISGATLRTIETVKDLQVSSTSIPVSGLPAGTYYITVQIGNWKETRTVLKL
jgi:chitodextrinase